MSAWAAPADTAGTGAETLLTWLLGLRREKRRRVHGPDLSP